MNLLLKEQIDVEIELVYPYEYKDDWQKFHKRSLPQKKDFYSLQKMEGFTGADYTPKSIYKKFTMKKLGKYHVLYVESDTYC